MGVSGSLANVNLPEVLQWLARARKTGSLMLTNAAGVSRVIFHQGKIVSTDSEDQSLVQLLADQNLVDRTTVQALLDELSGASLSEGELLARLGVTADEIDRALSNASVRAVLRLLSSREGSFSFVPGPVPSATRTHAPLKVGALLLSGAAETDERHRNQGLDDDPEVVETPEPPPVKPTAPAPVAAAAPSFPLSTPQPPALRAGRGAGRSRWMTAAAVALGVVLLATAVAIQPQRAVGAEDDRSLFRAPSLTPAVEAESIETTPPSELQSIEVEEVDPQPSSTPTLPLQAEPDEESAAPAASVEVLAGEPSTADLEEPLEQLVAARSAQLEEPLRTEYAASISGLRNEPTSTRAQFEPAPGIEDDIRQDSGADIAEESAPPAVAEDVSDPPVEEALPTSPEIESDPAPPGPPTRAGDLVEPGPGVRAPILLHHPVPRYPEPMRKLGQTADVVVRLLIDETGAVAEVERLQSRQGYGFNTEAHKVGSKSRWRPATKDGLPVKMWVQLRVSFSP